MLAAAGNAEAFRVIAERYQGLMYGVCRRITGNDADAVDALQETLVIMWQRLGTFEGRSAMSTWLYRIATNAAIDEVRRRARRPVQADSTVLDHEAAPDDVAGQAALRSAVDWALGRLPPQYRAAVVLRENYDLSYQEIADILDVPIDTVKSRISRGRQALAELLLPTFGSGD
ncbi:MAG TPA: sigma-70 family RNA polymerase sigma factor [Trebonia sp.]|nr:sigma-70 family RNA polymerase sigma factor [Trebonia sp.]